MNEINNLIEKIKNLWRGDTVTYTEMDMLRIIELLNKQVEELYEHVRTKDYYINLEDDLVRQIANNQKIMIEKLLNEKRELQNELQSIKDAVAKKQELHETKLVSENSHLQQRIAELEVQLKSKEIIINNQQGRLNYYATKDLLGGKNEQ